MVEDERHFEDVRVREVGVGEEGAVGEYSQVKVDRRTVGCVAGLVEPRQDGLVVCGWEHED